MQNRIEKAVLTRQPSDITDDVDRVYFGNEFCENKLPSMGTLRRWRTLATDRSLGFTFVTPFVTNYGLALIRDLLDALVAMEGATPEVVVNDWGVLDLVCREYTPHVSPVLGRLLTKQKRDPRQARLAEPLTEPRVLRKEGKLNVILPRETPADFFEHIKGSMINVRRLQDYLVSRGVRRVELDMLTWEMTPPDHPELRVSVYTPYNYLTVGRFCGKLTLSYGTCQHDCNNHFIRLDDEDLLVIGNTVFYETEPPSPEAMVRLGIDRVVYQPRLPF